MPIVVEERAKCQAPTAKRQVPLLSLFPPASRIPISMVATAFSLLVPMETEEAQIARGLRRRDPDLLDALIEQYQHRLLRYLLHLTGNRAVAEDLFQEVWVRVLEKGHLYDGRNHFVTWLMSIGHNVAIDHLRRRNPASLDEMQDAEDGAPFEPPSGDPSPFEQAAAHQQQQMFD